jgi:hypothetical protein
MASIHAKTRGSGLMLTTSDIYNSYRVENRSKRYIPSDILIALKTKLKTDKRGLAEELHKSLWSIASAQGLNARFDYIIRGTEIAAIDFLADQALGFGGNVNLHS